jgi:steroid 5-alpha reductase family enzyme
MKRFILLLVVALAIFCAGSAFLIGGGPLKFMISGEAGSIVAVLAAAFAIAAFGFGAVSGDYSWVDRLWSTVPVVFAWIYAVKGEHSLASFLAAALVTVWGVRLTQNFARRGGYTGTEDYRWAIMRSRIASPVAWQFFNAAFICGAQLGVIALFMTPIGRIAEARSVVQPRVFVAVSVLALVCIAIETVADAQRWKFHERKDAVAQGQAPADSEVSGGFASSGLFRLSRHPNYFGELGFWWCIYFLGAAADGNVINWTISGPIALSAIFAGSIPFTESISASKYPEYAKYRRRTSVLIPWFPGKTNGTGYLDGA